MGALVFDNYFLSSDTSVLNGQIMILKSDTTMNHRSANTRNETVTTAMILAIDNSRSSRTIPGKSIINTKITRTIITADNKHPNMDLLASKY